MPSSVDILYFSTQPLIKSASIRFGYGELGGCGDDRRSGAGDRAEAGERIEKRSEVE